MVRLFLFLVSAIGLFACRKQQLPVSRFAVCHNRLGLDSTGIATRLVGRWRWQQVQCFDAGKVRAADKLVRATFSADGTVMVTEGSGAPVLHRWRLERVDRSFYGLSLTPASLYFFGRLYFCGNEVLFNDSYRDGCDHLFREE